MAAVPEEGIAARRTCACLRREQMSKELRPAVSLASAWVAQLSRDEEVDAALLATRTDVVDFLSGKRGARLGRGLAGRVWWACPCAGSPTAKRRWPSTATAGCSWRTVTLGSSDALSRGAQLWPAPGTGYLTQESHRGLGHWRPERPVPVGGGPEVDRQGQDARSPVSPWRHRSWRSPCSRSGPGP